jgi:hypothetical protein
LKATAISAINRLAPSAKREIYARFVPAVLLERFGIGANFLDDQGRDLLTVRASPGTTDMRLDLRHEFGAKDPLLFAHLADTVNGQIHVLLYVVNDPASPRFDVDVMPDGRPTKFGVFRRNVEAELAAMKAGLAPGQVRRGLRIFSHSLASFEAFVSQLRQDLFFAEPLAYHNAVVFEGYGFRYAKGRRLMEEINAGFGPEGALRRALDGSTPFRQPGTERSVRGRSWAIHDGLLGRPYSDVTMYKQLGVHGKVDTFPDAEW